MATEAELTAESIAPAAPLLFASGTTEFDFDNDGKADASRWQSTGEWKIKNSSSGTFTTLSLGAGTAAAPADYDGDGITDRAIFTDYAGTWTIKNSSNAQVQTVNYFGQPGDKVVSGDYDSDGMADIAVFRPSTGTWYVRQSSNQQVVTMQFGAAGDIPVAGNYDGDSKMDYAVFRPSTATWYVLLSGSSYSYTYFQWGLGTDTPVPADYDGDGKTDFAVYRPSNGTWYVYKSSTNNGSYLSKTWGNYGDQPVPADYDGDTKADFAVWRPTSGVWFIVKSSDATFNTYEYHQLGIAGDVAAPSAYLKQIGGQVLTYDLANARLAPKNATGSTDLYSRNFSWGAGLVGLSGRAGLDAGFGISYNSLVWTKEPTSNTMVFDADNSNVSPGFRFGFPTIEPSYYNGLTQQYSYLMVTPSGGRVEFRQDAASGIYEAVDSSYAQLSVDVGGPNQATEDITLTVKTTDGTQMKYGWKAGAYRLSQIKDRSGNFITVVHDSEHGLLQSVTDTLGRVITVQYDSEFYPTTIKQEWKTNNGGVGGTIVQHTYATFSYTLTPIEPNFATGIGVFGPSGGTYIKVLSQITYPAGNLTAFSYNAYGQVYKIRNIAADYSTPDLNYVRTDLENPATGQTDCPRFSKTYNFVKDFNNINGIPLETLVNNTFAVNQTFTGGGGAVGAADVVEVWMDGAPHNTKSKVWYHTAGNWTEGLPFGTEDLAQNIQKRWTRTVWKQDDETKIYKINPRTTESRVGDETNTKKTTVDYLMQAGSTTASQFGLVKEVKVYDTNQTTILKRAVTDYNLSPTYLERRIIGLPSEQKLFDQNDALMSKVTYAYDEGDFAGTEQNISSVIQHDNTNYGASFITGRGNLTSTTRHDVLNGSTVSSSVKYNTAGAAVSQITPGATIGTTREVKISYADKFYDDPSNSLNRNTFAYPTKITDPAGNFSQVQYRYDIGANVWAKSPAPAGNTTGKETTREFDSVGRLIKEMLVNNGAYTRYDYSSSDREVHSKVYSTVIDTNGNGVGDAADEVLSEAFTDGAGRVRQSRTELPGGYSGSLIEYDILGQVKRSTVPTEINASWQPTGDDARLDTSGNLTFLWTSQEYDWKGRVTRQVNTDGTDRLVSYDGCGCAGGLVTTVQGEIVPVPNQANTTARRTQKVYADILGRTDKTVVMKWDGTTPYTTVVTTFNGRDQATSITQTDNETASVQTTTMTYDGHGRLTTEHRPEQTAGVVTTYNYNADDSISSVVDGRSAVTNHTYNSRGLLEQISYSVPTGSGIQVPANIAYAYDALGNRTQMTETTNPTGGVNGLGGTTYAYDSLSRLKSETRAINDPATGFNQSYTFNYTYDLAGQLTEFSDPADLTRKVTYARDKIGRVTSVGAGGFGDVPSYASNLQYRAFGAVKSLGYGSGKTLSQTFNNRLQLKEFNVSGGATTQDNLGSTNQYYADGRIKSAGSVSGNTYSDTFDRLYKYDHAGRILEAKSGLEARDETQTSYDRPYRQTYGYNAFSNLTNRTGEVWDTTAEPFAAAYTNNRNDSQYWTYDADGRNTFDENVSSYFDAAGRRYKTSSNPTIEQTFDGDGQRIKQTETNPSKKRYYVNSSVLGIIYEIEQSGTSWVKKVGMVYLNGQQLAMQNANQTVWWFYKNPATGSTRGTSTKMASETDPLGVNNRTSAPIEPPDTSGSVPDFVLPSRIVDPSNMSGGCQWEGLPMFCDAISQSNQQGVSQMGLNNGLSSGIPSLGGSLPPDFHPDVIPHIKTPYHRNTLYPEWDDIPTMSDLNKLGLFLPATKGEMCDYRLARIFGDEDAVMATAVEPRVLRNDGTRSPPRLRTGPGGENPELGDAHLFSNIDGTGVTKQNAFTPPGYQPIPEKFVGDNSGETQNFIRFFYKPGSLSNYGYDGGLIVNFTHIGPTNSQGKPMNPNPEVKNSQGSVLVGTIGGFGSPQEFIGGSSDGFYTHSHMIFNTWNGSKSSRPNKETRIDPRKVFCKDLGF